MTKRMLAHKTDDSTLFIDANSVRDISVSRSRFHSGGSDVIVTVNESEKYVLFIGTTTEAEAYKIMLLDKVRFCKSTGLPTIIWWRDGNGHHNEQSIRGTPIEGPVTEADVYDWIGLQGAEVVSIYP